MADPVITYECPIAGNKHAVPGPDVRVLRIGDGGFVVACGCGPESLAESDDPPHPTVDHLVNIYRDDPSPEQWMQLEQAADGWHDTSMWKIPEGYNGTNGQRRAKFREKMETIADHKSRQNDTTRAKDGIDRTDPQIRAVPCPSCEAAEKQKCIRPSGHQVKRAHADRIEAAKEAGVVSGDDGEEAHREQTSLNQLSAVTSAE